AADRVADLRRHQTAARRAALDPHRSRAVVRRRRLQSAARGLAGAVRVPRRPVDSCEPEPVYQSARRRRLRVFIPMTKPPLLIFLVACRGGGDRPAPPVCDTNPGGGLAGHDVPCDPGANGILLTASGEPFAINGYHFPPSSDQEVSLDDGWEITFDRVLTTF